jgi:hypothetical protein
MAALIVVRFIFRSVCAGGVLLPSGLCAHIVLQACSIYVDVGWFYLDIFAGLCQASGAQPKALYAFYIHFVTNMVTR